jgi:hypothetical protein
VGADVDGTVKQLRITVTIQIVPLNDIKELVVCVDVIYCVTIHFTKKIYTVWIIL